MQDTDDAIRLIHPRPITVLACDAGAPRMLVRDDRQAHVTQIIDVWRIDDEWWRDAVRRRYFLLELDDGSDASVFQDRVTGQWFEQRY